jgi:hypothetical protein
MSQAEFKIPEKVRNPGWANLKPAPKGVALNPAGRPKGSRNKLAESFIRDVYEKWEDQGPAVLAETIKRKPWEFVKIVAGLMPQKLEITNKFQSLPDAELADALARAIKDLATGANGGSPTGRIGNQRGIIEATAQSLPAISEADSVPRGGGDSPGAASDGGESAGEDVRRRG